LSPNYIFLATLSTYALATSISTSLYTRVRRKQKKEDLLPKEITEGFP
jgi:hypothetical protein